MRACEVVFTQSAYEDLDRITDYLLERNPASAQKIFEKLISSVQELATFPFMGPVMDAPQLRAVGYRRLVVETYSVLYRLQEEGVVIYHIFNHRQDYAKVFSI